MTRLPAIARAAIDYYLLGKKPAGPAIPDDGDDEARRRR